MLKLTMSPRKRSKRMRAAYVAKLRHNPATCGMSMAEAEHKVYENQESIADSLAVLIMQESLQTYKCEDYLSMKQFRLNVYDLLQHGRMNSSCPAQLGHEQAQPLCPADTEIDEYCREQIVEWSFRVVDYFRVDREVVVHSLSMLDRFLAICKCDRSTFKLAATTTLNLAVKILHPCKLAELGILSDLSRGEFDMRDVASMEKHILESLNWQLHPPTSIAFSTLLLDYFFSTNHLDIVPTDVSDLYDISSFFTELAICDYYFVGQAPSIVAIASIVNALEGMFGPENKIAPRVLKTASRLNMYQNQDLYRISHRLWELYERSEECSLHNNFDPMEEEKSPDCNTSSNSQDVFVSKGTCSPTATINAVSPVSVSKPCNNSMSSNDLMCAMRSQTLRNGSW